MLLFLQVHEVSRCKGIYLVDETQGLLGVEVTLAGHFRVGLAGVMLSNIARWAASAWVTLAVLGYAALAVSGVFALLAACKHSGWSLQRRCTSIANWLA